MTTSRYPEITDELLSAYIDGAVTGAERIAVEQAVRNDPDVAWRLTTLQATVHLLRSLPAVQAPRSFVLTAEQLGKAMPEAALSGGVSVERAPVAGTTSSPAARAPGLWERITDGWRGFWQGGSPALRNAMAASMAALLLLLIVPSLLSTSTTTLTYQAQSVPADAELASQVSTFSAKELQPLDAAQREIVAPAQESAAEAGEAEEPVTEQVVIAANVERQPAPDRATSDEGAAAELAAPAEAEMAAAASAGGARMLEDQSPVAAAAAMPESAAADDALAFAPSAAVEAQASGGAPALAAAAPVGADQAMASEPAAAGEGVLPAATALPEAGAGVENAASAESLPAAEEAAAAPAAEVPAAAPTTLSQPESPAPAVVMAPVATRVQPSLSDSARIAVEPHATQPASSSATQYQMWLWAQLIAATAVLVFGLLWWRSRRIT